ncbi:MAG TPA: hypothetical protein VFO89_04595, partial [Thermoanaerobaculia bacterium]|nr:hypothetical protein [Thermoanaerobaculia bacterium]
FDRDWLSGRVVFFIDSGHDRSLVLRRTSELLRTMLRHEPLIPLVSGVVQRLLQLGRHADALALVKALRLAPEFDDLYWLRQILDRGTKEIHKDVGFYLFNELSRADASIHRYVTALADEWLPPEERLPDDYSPANGAALLTVFAYCFEATDALDENLYGLWPSRFPIFAADRASAATQFSALLRCLFHPGLITVLGEEWEPQQLLREIARLLSRWVFILYGLSDQVPEAEEEGLDFRRDDALEVLVEQLLAVTKGTEGRAQRAVIVDEWEWAKAIYLNAPSRMGEEGHRRRRELGAKRRLMHDLITEFRRQQRAEHKAAAPTPQTATA